MSVLLRNATIVSMNGRREIFADADLLVADGRIAAIGAVAEADLPPGTEIVDLSGRIVLPGLVDAHVHTSQQLGRGIADDVDLLTWLRDRIWPFESHLTEDDQHLSTLALGVEMIRSGVTTFSEAGGQHVDAMGRAVIQLGLRAALCRSSMDTGEGLPAGWVQPTETVLGRQIDEHDRWHGAAGGRIRHFFGLRTIFNCSDELILKTKEIADARGTSIQMHVAEVPAENAYARETRGASTVEHLARLGVMGPNLMGIHCVWLTPREVELFAEHRMPAVHCPSSNMRILGFAPIPDLVAAGVPVGIGTDSPPCCNRSDMIDEIYLAALIHKGHRADPLVLPAERVLEMATISGARAMRWDDEIGSLDIGKAADLVVIDPRDIGVLPVHDLVSTLVYAMHSRAVTDSMVAGRWIMRGHRVLGVDEDALLDEIAARSAVIAKRAGIELPERFPVVRVR